MNFVFKPWQFALIVIAGWMHREQQQVIEYLRTENSVLREKLGKSRILLSDEQRRRMAVKGKILGYKRLSEVGTLFTPDTILRWHRQLIANKWDHSNKRSRLGDREPDPPTIHTLALAHIHLPLDLTGRKFSVWDLHRWEPILTEVLRRESGFTLSIVVIIRECAADLRYTWKLRSAIRIAV